MARKGLHLYEDLMLLALRDEEGTVTADGIGFIYSLGGSLLAELLLLGNVSLEEVKRGKTMVNAGRLSLTGDPLLDECQEKLAAAKRRASAGTWVSRFSNLKKIRRRAARQLCRRGILREDEKTVLVLFKKRIYPELNPGPERELIDRLRGAIFNDDIDVDPMTAALVALADMAGVLRNVFEKAELKARKARIKEISTGQQTAAAVKELLAATQVAVMTAITAAAVTSAT